MGAICGTSVVARVSRANRRVLFAADTRLRMSYGVAGGRRYTALKD